MLCYCRSECGCMYLLTVPCRFIQKCPGCVWLTKRLTRRGYPIKTLGNRYKSSFNEVRCYQRNESPPSVRQLLMSCSVFWFNDKQIFSTKHACTDHNPRRAHNNNPKRPKWLIKGEMVCKPKAPRSTGQSLPSKQSHTYCVTRLYRPCKEKVTVYLFVCFFQSKHTKSWLKW